jgi:polysaccharide biosynthesis protein PslG
MDGKDSKIVGLRPWAAALLTAAVLVALGAACGTARAADPVYGVTTPSSLKPRDLGTMKKGRVQALRLEISWNKTKRKGGGFDWNRTDRQIKAAAEHGLEVVPYLTGLPSWAKSCRKGHCQVPAPGRDGWLRFVSGAVERYGPDGVFWPVGSRNVTLPVSTWQIWNIANKSLPPRSYGTLLQASYRAIKLADPSAAVVTGALSYGGGKKQTKPTKFLRKLLRSNGKDSFSGVAVGPQSRSVKRVKAQLKAVRKVQAAAGRGHSGIWVTPIGWSSNRSRKGMGVGSSGQRSRLKHSMSMLRRGLGVDGVFWSRWRDGGGGCKWCRNSGLVKRSGKAKPAWKAYKKFLKKLKKGGSQTNAAGPFFFGVSPEDGLQLTPRDFALMQQAGIGSVRLLVAQQDITSGGTYHWGKLDEKLRRLALSGIQPLPLLFGDPASISQVNNPATMQKWRAFAAAAVNRYKPGSAFWKQFAASHPGVAPTPPHVWQLYNEQNNYLYWPSGPSAARYARLLDVSAQAIRGADPSARIMLGGMYGDDGQNGMPSWEFLRQLYQVPGAKDDFDIVAVHPFSFSLDGITWQIDNIRSVMANANDLATPIWITEMGWGSTHDDDPSKLSWWERDPQGQADMLTSAWNLLLQERKAWNIQGVYWYTWRDPGFQSCAFCESAGLLQNNFTAKPSFGAFERLSTAARTG